MDICLGVFGIFILFWGNKEEKILNAPLSNRKVYRRELMTNQVFESARESKEMPKAIQIINLRSRRLGNIGRAVLGNARGEQSREHTFTNAARPMLLKRLQCRLQNYQ